MLDFLSIIVIKECPFYIDLSNALLWKIWGMETMIKVNSILMEIGRDYWKGRFIERWFLLLETDISYKPEEF